jgi:hypothetical protein
MLRGTRAIPGDPGFDAFTNKCWNVPAVADGRVYVRSTAYVASFDLSVPALKMDLPTITASNVQLTVRTVNGTPITSNRLAGIELRAGTNAAHTCRAMDESHGCLGADEWCGAFHQSWRRNGTAAGLHRERAAVKTRVKRNGAERGHSVRVFQKQERFQLPVSTRLADRMSALLSRSP